MKTLNFVQRLSAQDALTRARQVAYNYNEEVMAIINGVVMIVYKGTDIKKALLEYNQKINLKFEIERMKAQNVKKVKKMPTMDFFPGLTPKQALLRAHNKACQTNETVKVILDGIVMFINKNTDIRKTFFEYHQKIKNR